MRFKFVPSLYSLAFALLGVVGFAGTASAATNPGTMQVSADTVRTCYIQAAAVDFGQIPAVINTPIDAVGNIDLQCSPNTSWEISADNGQGGQTHYPGQRHMQQSGEYLSYYLYTDSSRAVPWQGFDKMQGTSSVTGGVQQVPVYATINAGQIVTPNWYGDNVGLTVSFN